MAHSSMEPVTISMPSNYWLAILNVAREWKEGELEKLDALIELIRREFYILYEAENKHEIAARATLCNACQELLQKDLPVYARGRLLRETALVYQEFGDRDAARVRCDGANELLMYTKSLLQSVGVVEPRVDLWIECNKALRQMLDRLDPLPEGWDPAWPEPFVNVADSSGTSNVFPALHLLTHPSRACLIDN